MAATTTSEPGFFDKVSSWFKSTPEEAAPATGTAPELGADGVQGGRSHRRKHKKTRKHRGGRKHSKRVRTGRRSTRL